MHRINCYYKTDFGDKITALSEYADDGDYYDATDVDAELARLRTALTESQSRVEDLEGAMRADEARLQTAAAMAGITYFGCDTAEVMADTIGELRARVAELERENEELRADVVWAVRNGANAGYDGNSWPAIWHATSKPSMQTQHGEPVVSVEYDGTDADLCRAIREARCGARSESDE